MPITLNKLQEYSYSSEACPTKLYFGIVCNLEVYSGKHPTSWWYFGVDFLFSYNFENGGESSMHLYMQAASYPSVEMILQGIILTSPALRVRPTHPIFKVLHSIPYKFTHHVCMRDSAILNRLAIY